MADRSFTVGILLAELSAIALGLATGPVEAQLIHTATPVNRMGSAYHENYGINWSFRGPNFFIQSPGLAQVPFGNPDPNAGFRGGLGFAGGGMNGSLGFNFSQGSSTTISSTTPSITTFNGMPGAIQSQTIRPFVTGLTPVVGGGAYGQPTRDNVASQMERTFKNAQTQHLQTRVAANLRARQRQAEEAYQRGIRAEKEGNLRMARANYRRAMSYDTGPLRAQILAKLQRFR